MNAAAHDLDRIYQRIGELLVSFQWLEHRIREIGWLLLDPHRAEWPPTQLRNLTNHDLICRVQELYTSRVSTFSGAGSLGYCESVRYVMARAHDARHARNGLLHAAFVELKAGGEVHALMWADPRLVLDEDGEHWVRSEVLTEAGLLPLLASLGPLSVAVNMHYAQLIHWLPFDPPPRLAECGLPFHRTGLPCASDMPNARAQAT
jgi:hypothetical protein